MNDLCEKFSDDLVVLAFPCNQFGHQENCEGEQEIMATLARVRPGGGFVPRAEMFNKVTVNGDSEDPLFTFLKKSLPFPSDPAGVTLGNPQLITWSPVRRSDVAWNFEKFLISPSGVPVKRFSRYFQTCDVEEDILAAVEEYKTNKDKEEVEKIEQNLEVEEEKTEKEENIEEKDNGGEDKKGEAEEEKKSET